VFQILRGKSILDTRFVDLERDAELKTVTGFAYSNRTGALLTWAGRQIPLEYDDFLRTDATTGDEYSLFVIDLGSSAKVQRILGIGPYKFDGPEELDGARMLAVESLLVTMCGPYEAGRDECRNRVSMQGREWKISDFGPRSSTTNRGSNK
jgi:hypothetical protein